MDPPIYNVAGGSSNLHWSIEFPVNWLLSACIKLILLIHKEWILELKLFE